MPRYGMVIDLKRCYGCYACVMACKVKNHTPPGVFWARVLKGESGTYPNTVRQALPVLCNHCEEPSCQEVCPTGARLFGELGHRANPLERFRRFNHIQVLKAHLNTEPRVFYANLDGEVR